MLSLYVHIPFCVSKCRYCGFFSTAYDERSADAFLSVLYREAAMVRRQVQGRRFDSLYLGGGTPSMLSPGQFRSLFQMLNEHFLFSPNCERTVEANPESLSEEKLEALLRSGANRLSIGVQSLSDHELGILGRKHSARRAEEAVRLSKKAGFENVGIDLIFGIPGQALESWQRSVDRAIMLGPQHISAYALSLDDGTAFSQDAANGIIALPEEEHAAEMYEAAVDILSCSGYGRYEVSNFAKPGFECRHNENYWARGDYLGLGPGAWSFLDGTRRASAADMGTYENRIAAGVLPIAGQERIGPDEAAAETLLLGLRTSKGLDVRDYEAARGQSAVQRLRKSALEMQRKGIARTEGDRIRLTTKGMLLSDEVIGRLFT